MAEAKSTISLSGSTDGSPVHVTATTSGGAHTLHTAPTKGYDLVDVYGNNVHTGSVVISFELGGTGATHQLDVSLAQDTAPTEPLLRQVYMRNGLTLKAFADTTAVINLFGTAQRFE